MSERRRQQRRRDRQVRFGGLVRMVTYDIDLPPAWRDGELITQAVGGEAQDYVAINNKWLPVRGVWEAKRKLEKHYKIKRRRR